MDSSRDTRDDERLATALKELRPRPREEFAAELDERAAAGFPRRSRLAGLAPRALFGRLRATPPRRVLLPVGALATTVLVLGVVIAGSNLGGGSSEEAVEPGAGFLNGAATSEDAPEAATEALEAGGSGEAASSGKGLSLENFHDTPGEYVQGRDALRPFSRSSAASRASKRSVERSAQIAIGAPAGEVSDAAAQVFEVVHADNGIVLSSSLEDGSAESPEARFELLIPSGKLGDALASFSEIGEVLSRNEATADITAPTVGAAERLRDSRARIDSLLGQLAETTTEAERETVEAELRGERRRAARLRGRLAGLRRRANLSRVSLRIVSANRPSQGTWGVGDAFHDAGRLLAGAAAVAIVALAVLAPIALLALLAWLAHRAWLRRARTRALG
jgi:hypothetical protein